MGVGIYGDSMEDRHFEGLLNAYLDKADKEDEYDEYVENEIKEIMSSGADYYPFSPENLGEALTELGDKELSLISLRLAVCDAFNGNDDSDAGLLYKALSDAVKAYWYDVAKTHVEGLL